MSLTQLIEGNNLCLDLDKVKSKFHCDIDKDWIPDLCDDDIDGDGIKNLLWIIKYEKNDCSYNDDNLNVQRLQQEFDLAKNWQDIDNCPFKVNSDQIDLNKNGIGDKCENKKDTDNTFLVWFQIKWDPT